MIRQLCGRALAALLVLGATAADAATQDWWDPQFLYRRNLTVATAAVVPDQGYDGYTVRIGALDTATLVATGQLRSDCRDLRVLYYTGTVWQDLPRHLLGCNTSASDIRFQLPVALAGNANDDNFYLYYGNPAAGPAAAVTTTNVYRWYDDVSTNRIGSYTRGRIDPWHGSGWDDSLVYDAGGFYRYTTGDNFSSGYRLALDERDVLVEAEFFHVNCFPFNMTTGLMVRGIIASGSGGSESSNHYYASNRGESPQPGCNNAGGYGHDGAIMRRQRGQIAVAGSNPPDIVPNVWRRQALAAWSVNPTQLRFWDEDFTASWAALAYPAASNLRVSGSDGNDVEGRGFVAVMTAQDDARVRNILVRRYVEPEPSITLGLPQIYATTTLTVYKVLRTVSDPINGTNNPFNIPGAVIAFEIRVVNEGNNDVDTDTLVIEDRLAPEITLLLGDVTPGSGPVSFTDGAGAAASGLSYSYGGLGSGTDDIAFSDDGVGFGYTPTDNGTGADNNVRAIRISPSGSLRAGAGADPEFTLEYRVRVR